MLAKKTLRANNRLIEKQRNIIKNVNLFDLKLNDFQSRQNKFKLKLNSFKVWQVRHEISDEWVSNEKRLSIFKKCRMAFRHCRVSTRSTESSICGPILFIQQTCAGKQIAIEKSLQSKRSGFICTKSFSSS